MLQKLVKRRRKKYLPRFTSFAAFILHFKKKFKKKRLKKKQINISKRHKYFTRFKFCNKSINLERFAPGFLKHDLRKRWSVRSYLKSKFLFNQLRHWYDRHYFRHKLKKRNPFKRWKNRSKWGRKTFLRKYLWYKKTLFNLMTFQKFFNHLKTKKKDLKYRRYIMHYFIRRSGALRLHKLNKILVKSAEHKLFRQYKCYNLNLLTTKTNIFITITTFFAGSILFSLTPRRLDRKVYYNTKKRTTWAAQDVMRQAMKWLSRKSRLENRRSKNSNFTHKFIRSNRKPIFFVNLYGPKVWLHKRLCKLLFNTAKFSYFAQIRYKQATPHNGCPFQIRKRKKNKGWKNKWIKRKKRGKLEF